jgi:hypothetical protein
MGQAILVVDSSGRGRKALRREGGEKDGKRRGNEGPVPTRRRRTDFVGSGRIWEGKRRSEEGTDSRKQHGFAEGLVGQQMDEGQGGRRRQKAIHPFL